MTPEKTSLWWGVPRNFADRPEERKISWLELFYDLVYVAVVSQLTGHLAEHLNWGELRYFLFLFSLVFWSWMNGSLYHDIHGGENVRTRFFTLLQMLAVAAVAVTIEDVTAGRHQGFAISFACIQAIFLYLWWSTGYYDKSHRAFNRYYIINYSIGLLLFIVSAFSNFATANNLWLLALLANYSVVFFAAPSSIKELDRRGMVLSNSASMLERYGLFTIIVLGETVLGIVHGISGIGEKNLTIWAEFILAIAIAFSLWWLCFDLLGDKNTKPGYWYFAFLAFLVMPLQAGLAVGGASMRVILHHAASHGDNIAKPMFCAALGVVLAFTVFLALIMQQENKGTAIVRKTSIILVFSVVFIGILAIFGSHLDTLIFLGLVAMSLLVPTFKRQGVARYSRYSDLTGGELPHKVLC